MDLAEWLTRARSELSAREGRRVPQEEIAKAAGISRSYYGFLEAGINPTTGKPASADRELVIRLADALRASRPEALRAAGYGEQLTEDEMDVVRRFRRLDESQSEVVRRLLETLVPSVMQPPAPV